MSVELNYGKGRIFVSSQELFAFACNTLSATRGLAKVPDPHGDPPREISEWNQRTRSADRSGLSAQKSA